MRFYHLIKNRKFLRSAVAIKSKLKTKNSHSTTTKSNRTSKITAVVPRTPKRNQQKRKEKIHFWPIFKKFRSIQFNKKKNEREITACSIEARTQPKRNRKKKINYSILPFWYFFQFFFTWFTIIACCMLRCQFRFIFYIQRNIIIIPLPCPARAPKMEYKIIL